MVAASKTQRIGFLLALDLADGRDTAVGDLGGTMVGISRAILPDNTDLRIITKFSEFLSAGTDTPLFKSRGIRRAEALVEEFRPECEARRACWYTGAIAHDDKGTPKP